MEQLITTFTVAIPNFLSGHVDLLLIGLYILMLAVLGLVLYRADRAYRRFGSARSVFKSRYDPSSPTAKANDPLSPSAEASDPDLSEKLADFFKLSNMEDEVSLFCRREELETRERQSFLKEQYKRIRGPALRRAYLYLYWKEPTYTWETRFTSWQNHLDRLVIEAERRPDNTDCKKAESSPEPANSKEAESNPENKNSKFTHEERSCNHKMKHVSGLLSVLDTKFQMLLNVNGAMLAIEAVMLKQSKELVSSLWSSFQDPIYVALAGMFIALIFCGLFNVAVILKGFRRVVWGDLGKHDYPKNLFFLIVSISRRTNWFRISARATELLFPILGMLLLCCLCLPVLLHRQPAVDQTKAPVAPPMKCQMHLLKKEVGEEPSTVQPRPCTRVPH